MARISLSTDWSHTLSWTAVINRSCGIAEKQLATSVSTTHRRPRPVSSTRTCRASCWPRFGRNPKLHGPKSAHENFQGVVLAPFRAKPETTRGEVRLEDRLKHDLECGLHNAVAHRRNRE